MEGRGITIAEENKNNVDPNAGVTQTASKKTSRRTAKRAAKKATQKRSKRKGSSKNTIPGQGTPKDTAAARLWGDNNLFAGLFNHLVFKSDVIHAEELKDANAVEAVVLSVKGGFHYTLKNTRDVSKEWTDGTLFSILGVENQTTVCYEMPFRILELDFINYGRQVTGIHQKRKEWLRKNKSVKVEPGERMYRFFKEDKIRAAITIVAYFGDDPWDGPKDLLEMMEENPIKSKANGYPIRVLDIKHLSGSELESFPDELKACLGLIRYSGQKEIESFATENREILNNLPIEVTDALLEITGAKELIETKAPETDKGGNKMCKGIVLYGDEREARGKAAGKAEGKVEGKAEGWVRSGMAWGKTEEEIVEQLMRQASMDQPTAKAFVEKISDLMAKEEAVRSFLQEGHKLEEAPRFLMADHGMDEASAKALVEELVMMDSLGKQPT